MFCRILVFMHCFEALKIGAWGVLETIKDHSHDPSVKLQAETP